MRILPFTLLGLLVGCSPYGPAYPDPDGWSQPWAPREGPREFRGSTASAEHGFRLHHDDRDPELVEPLMEAAERAWQLNLDWGATPPPADDRRGPDELIDLYLVDDIELLGSASRFVGGSQLGCAGSADVLVRPLEELDAMRWTLQHEIRHLFQFFANCTPLAYQEGDASMAAWAGVEERVGGEAARIADFQEAPELSVFAEPESPRLYEYGAMLFHRFLAERYGDGGPEWFTRQVLGRSPPGVIAQVEQLFEAVVEEGDTPEELLADFGIARLMTPDRGEDAWWTEEGPWPFNAVPFEYVGQDAAELDVDIAPTGSTYVAFDPSRGFSGRIEGSEEYRHVLVARPVGQGPWVYFPPDEDGRVELPGSEVFTLGFWAVSNVRWELAVPFDTTRLIVERFD